MFNYYRLGSAGLASILVFAAGCSSDDGPSSSSANSSAGSPSSSSANSSAGKGGTAGSKSTIGGSNAGGTTSATSSSGTAGSPHLAGSAAIAGESSFGGATSQAGASSQGASPSTAGSPGNGGASIGGTMSTTAGASSGGIGAAAGMLFFAGSAGVAGDSTAPKYVVSATVSNLHGTGMVLRLNGTTDRQITTDGAAAFSATLSSGQTYAVTVATQPSNPPQLCLVKDGTGTIEHADISNITVKCSQVPRYYLVVDGADNSVSTYVIDAESGRSTYIGKAETGGAPTAIAVDPKNHQYAYVTNAADSSISEYSIGADGVLSPLATPTIPTGTSPSAIAIDLESKFVYVANSGSNNVSQYSIGNDGLLSAIGSAPVAVGTKPTGVAIHRSGAFAYVTNAGDNNISQFSVAADGTLSPLDAAVESGSGPASVTVDPTGGFAYVANSTDSINGISQYSIQNGRLTKLAPASIGAGSKPLWVTVDPTGQYVYAANGGSATVSQYKIGADGKLAPMTATTVPTEGAPSSILVDPTGRYVYVANATGDSISQFKVTRDGTTSNGSLVANAPPRVAAQVNPVAMAIVAGSDLPHPYGKFLYVTNDDNTLWQYSIASSDGALSASTPVPMPGMGPASTVVDPTGSRVYVVNTSKDSVSPYGIAVNGSLTAIGSAPTSTGLLPTSIALHPSNRYAYVTSKLDRSIFQYFIGVDGSLSAMSPPSIVGAADGSLAAIQVDPSGRYAFVAVTNGTIARFEIAVDGALNVATATYVPAGSKPAHIAIAPSGTHLYAANSLSGNVSQFGIAASIHASGTLSALVPDTVEAGSIPYCIVLDPSGKHAYVANSGSGSISQYSVELTDPDVKKQGALAVLAPSPVEVGANGSGNPLSIVVDPSGRYAYAIDSRDVGGAVWRYTVSISGTQGSLVSPVSAPSGASSRSLAVSARYW